MSDPCHCCEQPPCPDAVLEFRESEASCITCGYPVPTYEGITPEDAVKCYRTKKYTFILHSYAEYDLFGTHRIETTDITIESTWEIVSDGEGGCVEQFVSGTYHSFETAVWVQLDDPFATVTDWSKEVTTSAGPDEVWSGTEDYINNLNHGDDYSIPSDESGGFIRNEPTTGWSHSGLEYSITVGDEDDYTTKKVLLSDVNTPCDVEFPEFEGDWFSSGSASRENGVCGEETTLRKCQWRVVHPPSGTCYLKVWVRGTFTPTVGSPTTSDDIYEWFGTGNPCFASPTNGVDHPDNQIHGNETEEPAPDDPGVVTFEILKFACCEGYEPDISDEDNPQPNGYPDPTWEAEPP